MNDIYDADLFELHSFHILEYDENKIPFRWTDGLFKIVQKQETNNICLKFLNTINDKKIIVFIENDSKSIKHEYSLQNGSEYILTVSVLKNDKVR